MKQKIDLENEISEIRRTNCDNKNLLNSIASDASLIRQTIFENEYIGNTSKKPLVNLQQFQIHLAHHCNLNCISCNVFSSIAEEEYPDYKEMEKDLRRISELSNAEVNNIIVSGGEPLLNKDINDYLRLIRKYFPETNILIITNGLLIKRMTEEFWKTCAEVDAEFYPTLYRIKIDWDYFKDKCKQYNIRYDLSIVRDDYGFSKLNMDWRGRHNARSMFEKCSYGNRCISLEKGKLYTCSTASCIGIYNKKFNMHFPEANGIDIYKANNIVEILEYLSKPLRFCAYCAQPLSSPIEWKRSSLCKDEWLQFKQV